VAIKIITDSTSDLTAEVAKKWDIEVEPLTISFGDEVFADGVDITRREFYERLSVCTSLPTTAQVNPERFYNSFKKHTDEGNQVVCVLISQVFSGTIQSALIAMDMLGEAAKDVFIIDSKTACLALGALAIEAAKLRDLGLEVNELVKQVNELKEKVILYAIVDDLKYLAMGGRLSKTNKVIGSLLGIKPIVLVTKDEIKPVEKVRGTAKGCEWLVSKLEQDPSDLTKTVFAGHTNAPEKLEQFINIAGDKDYMKNAMQGEIGPTVGVHGGPGCIGFAYFRK